MPGRLRVEFPGAIYHVMSRGDRREEIFEVHVVVEQNPAMNLLTFLEGAVEQADVRERNLLERTRRCPLAAFDGNRTERRVRLAASLFESLD